MRRGGRALLAEAVEGLRAGDLVQELEVDVEQIRLTVLTAADHMIRPDLLRERARHDRYLLAPVMRMLLVAVPPLGRRGVAAHPWCGCKVNGRRDPRAMHLRLTKK